MSVHEFRREPDVEDKLAMCGVPPKCQRYTRETWVGEWPLPRWAGVPPWSVTILGPTGVGKTHLATALFGEQLMGGFEDCPRGTWGWWYDTAAVLDMIRDEFRPPSTGSRTREKLFDPRLLMLDDIGIERPTEFALDTLRAVLCHRYNQEAPTIVTSNAESLDELDAIDPRVSSRLAEGIVLVLDGPDRRLEPIEATHMFDPKTLEFTEAG